MTLFALLLSLALERLFKLGNHWSLDNLFKHTFERVKKPSTGNTLILLIGWMALLAILFSLLKGVLFGLFTLLLVIIICWLCIGADITRQHYRSYLVAAKAGDTDAMNNMADELALIHGLPVGDETERLKELQNALLWINFRYYIAPLFWVAVLGQYGPIALGGYALLRSYQIWLVRYNTSEQREKSAVDRILHWVDWLPVRFAGLIYSLLSDGEKALPVWIASLSDLKIPAYDLLARLAQISLATKPHNDTVETPIFAVTLAKKATLVSIVIIALLTIYGALT